MWKREKSKKKMSKILSSCVVLCMVLTAFAVITPSVIADDGNGSEPSLRIYGEVGAVYPTQSYTGAKDFIYPKEYDPFDPGIIEKDSITFNPAFWFGHDQYEILAKGDASEKIFLRAFYEPGYTHPEDDVMDKCSMVDLLPVETFDAIVTETTYALVTLYDRDPTFGYAGATKFALPYVSSDPVIPGMDEAGLLDVAWVSGMQTKQLTDGGIEVEKEYVFSNIDYTSGETIRFMDHKVTIDNFENNDPEDDKLDIYVSYIGNMNDRIEHEEKHTILENSMGPDPSNNYYFSRTNHKMSGSDPCHRWYLRIENADDDYLRITVGRRLVAGETFYVDGVRYDMPAIYVKENRDLGDEFKYITLQSPIPKGTPVWDSDLDKNVNDFSHVTSQYLAHLPQNENAWLLPPFSESHIMIDDIGLKKLPNTCLPVAGVILDEMKDPLEFRYIDETVEGRFESSLAERLHTGENEEWYWYNVFTKPNHYTEFVLPDQETKDDYYDTEDSNRQSYTYSKADGNEYLITSSFIAPNSDVDLERSDRCKSKEEHEIFDRVAEIALNGEREEYYEMPRFVFEFDAYNHIDFFINEETNEPSVRIYGEECFDYPTQSYTGEEDFVYEKESDAFDPGVIKKDSITFNPAFIDGEEGTYQIKAQGDASEKIFLRVFYEPGYTHPIDKVMDDCSSVSLESVEKFDAIVTETTYFLTTLNRQPKVGYPIPDETKVYLPYMSADSEVPGMEHADLLDVMATRNMQTRQLTDGIIAVEKEYKFLDNSYIGTPMYFMDHKLIVENFENCDPDFDKLDFTISYVGNMDEAISSEKSYTISENLWNDEKELLFFDRENDYKYDTDPCHRWYLRVENADDDYLRMYLGRALKAGETFYVDGVRYDMPAIYVDGDGGFKYITLQSPIPKGSPKWQYPLYKNVNDFSHVTSQYLAKLAQGNPVWLLPPFNENHLMIDDIGLQKKTGYCLPAEGVMLSDEKDALEFVWTEETVEDRFESSLAERLHTEEDEEWYWYNVFTKPNHYTEFILPDQETTEDHYNTWDCDMINYPYSNADGNEYLITSSLIAPNSNLDLDRSDLCKQYDHEIFSALSEGENGNTASAQLAMVLDGSGSINAQEWNIMINGLSDAVKNNLPHDGSVEFTVIQFSTGTTGNARVEVGPIVVTDGNYQSVATSVENIKQLKGNTPLAAGIDLAKKTLDLNNEEYTRQIVNIVTDGVPNVPSGSAKAAAVTARDNMISTLGMNSEEDEIDAEGVGISSSNIEWLRANIVWPQPGYDNWPPTGPGWVRAVSDFEEFSETIAEKFDILFVKYAPRVAYEFDACDGTGLYINSVDEPNNPPTAEAGGDSEGYYYGDLDTAINFDGSGSHDNDEGGASIVSYAWDFGDGNTGTGMNPSHMYTNEGEYTVTLTVTDDEGSTDTDTATASICGFNPLVADANGPYSAEEPAESIMFDGSGSTGNIVSYAWDFGDGNTGTGMNPTHSYGSNGVYTVTLTVTDSSSNTDMDTTTATVGQDSVTIKMDDVDIDCQGATSYAYIHATNVVEHVGSVTIALGFDPTQVSVVSVDDYEFDNLLWSVYDDELYLSGYMSSGQYLTGDFNIGRIGFEKVGNIGCDLEIKNSELLDDASSPLPISHVAMDGYADINCNNPTVLGDMNGDGAFNSGDVRWLAIYYASGGNDPEYRPLHADGDVNNDGSINSGDVRYLAIFYASGGNDPEYSPLYP